MFGSISNQAPFTPGLVYHGITQYIINWRLKPLKKKECCWRVEPQFCKCTYPDLDFMLVSINLYWTYCTSPEIDSSHFRLEWRYLLTILLDFVWLTFVRQFPWFREVTRSACATQSNGAGRQVVVLAWPECWLILKSARQSFSTIIYRGIDRLDGHQVWAKMK